MFGHFEPEKRLQSGDLVIFFKRELFHLAVDLLQMSKVPWYKQRLKALLFKARFADKVEEIKPVGVDEIGIYFVTNFVNP